MDNRRPSTAVAGSLSVFRRAREAAAIADFSGIGQGSTMDREAGSSSQTRAARVLGWGVLVLFLPVAFFAALHPPNEYQATLGLDALDCDGPFETYIFAVPALLIYGVGLFVNGVRWRVRVNAVVALLCFAICTAVIVNVLRAVAESRRQAADCQLMDGS